VYWQIGMSALHWAVQKTHVDIVHLLLQHGANAYLQNKVCTLFFIGFLFVWAATMA